MRADHDLVIIGGGAGGLGAARMARHLGASTLLVQRGAVGGDCTFTGCVPSKTVLDAAARGASFREAFSEARSAVERIAATESAEVLAALGTDVIDGWARFAAPGVIDVEGRPLRAKRVILATGAGPLVPAITGVDGLDVLTNETFFDLSAPPESLAVLGGGPIGCELGQAMARLGVRVVLYEALPRVLPREEVEASETVTRALTAAGVEVRTGETVVRVDRCPDGAASITVDSGETTVVERVLAAVGRRPETDGLGLDAAGVDLDHRGFVAVDATMATSARGVWAVGDVTGTLMFTHAADEMGRVAAQNALRRRSRARFEPERTPWVTFVDPEVARIGLTETEAAARDKKALVAHVPMSEFDRAITSGRTDGFVKLIAGRRPLLGMSGGGQVIGATIVAPRAGEMIHEVALAMRTRMFTGRLAQTSHAYPTWSVAVQLAASKFFLAENGARPATDRAG